MKQFQVLSVVCLLMMSFQCGKGDKDITPCIENKIASFPAECCSTGATVKKYNFQNDFVYVFDLGPCGNDFTSAVLSESCDTLGMLGGIAGITQINGENFSNAVFIETVWSN